MLPLPKLAPARLLCSYEEQQASTRPPMKCEAHKLSCISGVNSTTKSCGLF